MLSLIVAAVIGCSVGLIVGAQLAYRSVGYGSEPILSPFRPWVIARALWR